MVQKLLNPPRRGGLPAPFLRCRKHNGRLGGLDRKTSGGRKIGRSGEPNGGSETDGSNLGGEITGKNNGCISPRTCPRARTMDGRA